MTLTSHLVYGIFILLNQTFIVTALAIVVVFFLILLILGIKKSYALKKENDKLCATNALNINEDNKAYEDFRKSHLYDND